MNALDAFKPKLMNERINSINLLADRIEKHALATRKDMEGDPRESGTGSHIEESLRFDRKISRKGQGIDNMKNQSLMDILDTSEIHILINLLHIQKMLNTQSRLIDLDVDIHGIAKRTYFLSKCNNLRIRHIKIMKRDYARSGLGSHKQPFLPDSNPRLVDLSHKKGHQTMPQKSKY